VQHENGNLQLILFFTQSDNASSLLVLFLLLVQIKSGREAPVAFILVLFLI